MRNNSEQSVGRTNEALGWSSRIMHLTRVLGSILFFVLLHNPVQAVQSVTFAWDPSPDPTVVGYNMYYGVASQTYTNMLDAGNATSVTVPGLVEGVTYFFAATAYDMVGLESVFSNEISYIVPAAFAKLLIGVAANGQVALTVTGRSGHTYDIQATEDFTAWTVIGTVTLDTSASSDLADTNATSIPKRFYRTEQKP